MKKLALFLMLFSLPAMAEDTSYADRMKLIQQNQHRRPDAVGYVNNLQAVANQPVALKVNRDGHFYTPVIFGGKQVDMMADTGASGIFLSKADAQKMGVNISSLNYNIPYDTANGRIYAAEIIAPKMQVGNITLENVPVTISQNGNNDMSLLGMEFFKRLSKYDVKDGVLTLYK